MIQKYFVYNQCVKEIIQYFNNKEAIENIPASLNIVFDIGTKGVMH